MTYQEITLISGKGGTGKTTFTASLIPYFTNAVIADCDVDAPDLDILLKPEVKTTEPVSASRKAFLDPDLCQACGKCRDVCRFDAVTMAEGRFAIDPVKCEGCGVCTLVCPARALDIKAWPTGVLYESETDWGPMVHARLSPGEEVSGRLVSLVRTRAKEIAQETKADYVLIDGPPGVACNVISAITGASLALVVTEPTVAGFHDMKRVVETADKVRVKSAVVINKSGPKGKDCSESARRPDLESQIEEYCRVRGIPLLGRIPLSRAMRRCTNRKEIASLALPDFPERNFWPNLVEEIKGIL